MSVIENPRDPTRRPYPADFACSFLPQEYAAFLTAWVQRRAIEPDPAWQNLLRARFIPTQISVGSSTSAGPTNLVLAGGRRYALLRLVAKVINASTHRELEPEAVLLKIEKAGQVPWIGEQPVSMVCPQDTANPSIFPIIVDDNSPLTYTVTNYHTDAIYLWLSAWIVDSPENR